jgi:hypothetical protein
MPDNPLITVTVTVALGSHRPSDTLTPYQILAAIEAHIGATIRLPHHSKLIGAVIEEERVAILFTKYEAQVMARETRYASADKVLHTYTRADGMWSRSDVFTVPDDTFTPHVVHESAGVHRDEHEQMRRRTFEGDCYRPGTSKAPMDNAARTAEGYTTLKMEKHWS